MRKNRNILFVTLLLLSLRLQAQPIAHFSTVKEYETALKPFAVKMLKSNSDEERSTANKKFILLFEGVLELKDAYAYNFDSLINLKVLLSDDHHVKIYTWTVPSVDRTTYEYYGYIQVLHKKQGLSGLFSHERFITNTRLKDGTKEIPDPQNSKLKPERWLGAWYYKIITNKYLGKTYYTLLGWKGNDRLTTMKVIDNITIASDGKITFGGSPVLKDGGLAKYRDIFEFSAGVSMSLHYEEGKTVSVVEKADRLKKKKEKSTEYKNAIVFDHISAPEGKFAGQREFYGPDLSLDAYYFKKGKWLMLHNVSADNNDKLSATPPPLKYKGAKSLYKPPKHH